jgi:hypothetical protein
LARCRHDAEIVSDKFHVLQHASAALDDLPRQEFFRAGLVMRKRTRETLTAAAALEGGPRIETLGTPDLVDANRRLFNLRAARSTRSGVDISFHHIQCIPAYSDHPVRFGLIGWINTAIKAAFAAREGCVMNRLRLFVASLCGCAAVTDD